MPPPSVKRELYCFPRRRLIIRFGVMSYIIQKVF